ncbi:hypothetical protein ASE63_25965 [Bosea sp. Root381]|nr:hypothetical protein ASE63_25965 [Bosea sp. Root381]
MPYADPQTRRDRRRDYMRELMRELMRERRARARDQGAVSARVSSAATVSSRPAVSTPEPVSTAVGSRPAVSFPSSSRPPNGLTPLTKASAKKVFRLFTDGVTAAERNAARLRLLETATKTGLSPADLMVAIGAPRDALDVPHA